jgi:hypothetical protein
VPDLDHAHGVAETSPKREKKVEKVAGGHACEFCHEPPDGTEQQCALADETVWLHQRCQRPYLDLDIPPNLRRAP